MGLLEMVKKSLLIPLSEDYADLELTSLIASCKDLIKSAGVSEEVINKNRIVESLILIYCKTFFGFKTDGSVKELPKSFDMLLTQLATSSGDIYVSE